MLKAEIVVHPCECWRCRVADAVAKANEKILKAFAPRHTQLLLLRPDAVCESCGKPTAHDNCSRCCRCGQPSGWV